MRTRHRALCLFSTLAVPCSLLPGLKTNFDHNNLFILHLNYSILKGRFKKLTTVSREEGVRSGAHSATWTPPRTAGEAPARRQLPANYPPPGHRSGAGEDPAQPEGGQPHVPPTPRVPDARAATLLPHYACANVRERSDVPAKRCFSLRRARRQQGATAPAASRKLTFEPTAWPKEHASLFGDNKQSPGQGGPMCHCPRSRGVLPGGSGHGGGGHRPAAWCRAVLSRHEDRWRRLSVEREKECCFTFLFKPSSSATGHRAARGKPPPTSLPTAVTRLRESRGAGVGGRRASATPGDSGCMGAGVPRNPRTWPPLPPPGTGLPQPLAPGDRLSP